MWNCWLYKFLVFISQLLTEIIIFTFIRSYGRPPKTVKLKANFVRLSEGMLVNVSRDETYTTASSLHKQPFFHIYWTDCQVKRVKWTMLSYNSNSNLSNPVIPCISFHKKLLLSLFLKYIVCTSFHYQLKCDCIIYCNK